MRSIVRIALLTLLAAGCAAQSGSDGRQGGQRAAGAAASGVEPALAVERFLQAANAIVQSADQDTGDLEYLAGELRTMARLFGTPDGSILNQYSEAEVEERMFALASLLRHDDYSLAGRRIVPGRTREAVQIVVRLSTRQGQVAVPFTVVQAGSDGWLIEQIDVEPITSGG